MIDYHLHLWPHEAPADPPQDLPAGLSHDLLHEAPANRRRHLREAGEEAAGARAAVSAYLRRAAELPVPLREIAVTEHLFRFQELDRYLGHPWAPGAGPGSPAVAGRDAALVERAELYWAQHCKATLGSYVEAVTTFAGGDGDAGGAMPVRLGLEVDHYPGMMALVGEVLSAYPFDVLLGAVHFIGPWMLDNIDDTSSMSEWGHRGLQAGWEHYVEAVEDLAASGTCDVLAHPDLPKVTGLGPVDDRFLAGMEERIADALAASGMAAEVSSAGWRKPAGEAYPSPRLLGLLHARRVPVTTASDAHVPEQLGWGFHRLTELLGAAGYEQVAVYSTRQMSLVDLDAR